MRVSLLSLTVAVGVALAPVVAAAQAEKTLHKCQKTIGSEVSKYAASYQKELGKCLDEISKEVIQNQGEIPPGSVADAAEKCAKSLRKLLNTEKPEKQIGARMTAKIAQACDPDEADNPKGFAKVLHTEADLLGTGLLAEQIDAAGVDALCGSFGGDGAIDDATVDGSGILEEWTSCLAEAATCEARQALALRYPRLLEWLNALRPEILALDETCGTTCGSCSDAEVADACNALESLESAVDGDSDDDLPELACPGHRGSCGAEGISGSWSIAISGDLSCLASMVVSQDASGIAIALSGCVTAELAGAFDPITGAYSVSEASTGGCVLGAIDSSGTFDPETCSSVSANWSCAGAIGGTISGTR